MLDNGLRVLIQSVHTAPLATVWCWYRVGSRDEISGLTGVSHWVEHMNFKGTTNIPRDQIKGIIEEQAGAHGARGTTQQKIGDLYNQYMDVDALESKGLTPLEPWFKQIAAAKSHKDIAALMGKMGRVNGGGSYRGGGNTPFAFYIDQDEKVPSQYIPHFVQSGLGLPDENIVARSTEELVLAGVSVDFVAQ